MREFVVRIVGETEDEDGYTIDAADGPPSDTALDMQVQRAAYFEDQDIALGQDTYCLVTHPGANVHYGGALGWRLDDRVLVVHLDETAGNNLEAEGGFRLDLSELSDADVKKLEAGLIRAFAGEVRRDHDLAT